MVSLQAVATELGVQDGLEWRVINGALPPAEAEVDLARSRARAGELIALAGQGGLSERAGSDMRGQLQRYAGAVDEELRLVANGNPAAARLHDAGAVDPAFQSALLSLRSYTREVGAGVERAQRLSDATFVFAVVLFVGASAVQGRRRLSEVQRQQELRSDARYRAIVDQSTDIVVVADRHGQARYLSPSAERLLGSSPDRLTGPELYSRTHPDDRELLAAVLRTADAEQGALVIELRLRDERHDKDWRAFEMTVQDMDGDAAIGGLVLTGHDVTDRQRLQAELEHRALHDPLTGLPNRALLADRFGQSLRAARRGQEVVGLLLIDLDRFKEVNDTLGHHFGDRLLIQVGARFGQALRASDTIARLGGDEFAVLLPSVSGIDAATEVATMLQAELDRSFIVDGVELDVEASIGVVVSGGCGEDADAAILLQRADIAMYVAKQGNLRITSYDPASDAHTPERLALLGDLRRALQNNELLLHFQPKVSLSTGAVCGAEALVRWQHPERGLLAPGEFIPMAENTGLIGPLTRHVLDLALAQARRWADQGQPLQVAVNLSARNLLDDHLDRTVADLLAEHGVPPHLLKLEVTESAIMIDPIRAGDVLHRLAGQGINISIDDFGAGYTSLGQLKTLPVTELKIDLSFVATMDTDTSNDLIVRSVIELGHNLGLTAVAEGVESAAILGALIGSSCDVVQGYHLSHPLPVGAFDTWRAAWAGLARQPEPQHRP